MTRRAYEVEIPAGPRAVLAELTCSEVLDAMRLAGPVVSQAERGLAVGLEALRLSLREVDGQTVSQADLQAGGLAKVVPRTRHRLALARAWVQAHTPTDAEVEAMLATMAVESAGTSEAWTVTLPGGREVVLEEQSEQTVGEALRAAEKAARSPAAQEFASGIEQLRRSVKAVDGRAVSREDLGGRKWDGVFSVRETHLLTRAWSEIHVGAAEEVALAPVGEPKPGSGTR